MGRKALTPELQAVRFFATAPLEEVRKMLRTGQVILQTREDIETPTPKRKPVRVVEKTSQTIAISAKRTATVASVAY